LERGAVSYANAWKKRFQNAVLACVLLGKNFWNSIPVYSDTKVPLIITKEKV
jgi:hypothetical protein